jgi:tetratricopeptide (TPR) repeat protein
MFLKNCLFSVVIISLFFTGCELVLAIAGVRPTLATEDPFVGFAENVPLFVEARQADGSIVMRAADNKLQLFNYQAFPREKGANSYRVFCMGGSTTYGRPYDDPVSFCGWLRAYLKAADPARNWEVINAGGVSYASYRVARLMSELVQYQPDLFIVYSGQNEFLEQRSYGGLIDLPAWLVNLNATLSSTRVYTALSKVIAAAKSGPPGEAKEHPGLNGEVDTILDHTIGPESYHRDDVLKDRIMTHYRLNLQRMVRIARQADADIMFVKPAINIKDMSPFKSEHTPGLGEKARADWQELYDRAKALEDSGDDRAALTVYRQAMEIDDRYADLHYRAGKTLFSLGDYGEAEREFRRAVAEDIAPLRILEPMQQAVVDVAATEAVPLIDFTGILRTTYLKDYGHAVFGKEYFVDHVHTNKEAYRLLGLALFDELVRRNIAKPDASWGADRIAAVNQQVLGNHNVIDEGHALVKLAKVLAWAGKFTEAYDLFRQGMDILGPNPKLYEQLARTAYALDDQDAAIRYLQELLEHYPSATGVHPKLAVILAAQGKTEIAVSHCRMELLLNPGSPSVTAMLAELLERQGKVDEARLQYERALRLKPEAGRTRIKLANLLLGQGQDDEALLQAREALRSDPEQSLVHNVLGRILQRKGETEQAAHHFSEALRLDPGNRDATESLQNLQSGQWGKDIAEKLP